MIPVELLSGATEFPDLRLTGRLDKQTKLPLYRLQKEVTLLFRVNGRRVRVRIQEGYETDLASLPKIARVLFDPADPCAVFAALLHDWLYSGQGGLRDTVQGFDTNGVIGGVMTKEEVDAVFYFVMRANAASYARARVYFHAVNLFGQSAWNSPE